MSNGRVAGFIFKDLGPDGGPWTEFDDPKIEVHTIEGSSIAGAEQAMKSYPSAFLIDPGRDIGMQYITTDKSSYANKAHDTARIYQCEVVGFAGKMHLQTDAWLKTLGKYLWLIMDHTGVPAYLAPQGFHGEGEGFILASPKSKIRFTVAQLLAFSGLFGHQHMPAPDDHWDPGRLAVLRALQLARPERFQTPLPTTPGLTLSEENEMNRHGAWLFQYIRDLYAQYCVRPIPDHAGLSAWLDVFRKDQYFPSYLNGGFNHDQAAGDFIAVLKMNKEFKER